MAAILGSVPADLFPSACDEALAAFKGPDRSRILAGIIHRFPADQQPARWGRCLDDCRSIGDIAEQAKALAFLVGRVPADSELAFVAKVAAALEAVDDPADRSEALLMLAGWAPEAQRIEFFARALEEASVPRERFRPRPRHPLINLCEGAPEPLLGRVLQAIRDQEDPSDRAELMLALAPRLPESDRDALLAEALEAAFAPHRRGVVPHLASRLFGVLPEPTSGRAWELIRAMDDPRKQARVLEAFLPHLPDSLLDRVEADLPNLQLHQFRSWGEIQFAERRLGREAARELLWARELDIQINSPFRLHALVQSTLGLPEGEKARLFADALEQVAAIEPAVGRSIALKWLIPRLPEGALDRALEIGIRPAAKWASPVTPLLDLADRFPEHRRRPIYDYCIRSLSGPGWEVASIRGLRCIADRDEEGPEWPLLAEVIRWIAGAGRARFLEGIEAIAPWLDRHLSEEDWLEFGRALEDVACAWP